MTGPDAQLFLLSWTQLRHALWLSPDNEAYSHALRVVENRLAHDYGITDLSLMAHSVDGYTISFRVNDVPQILGFADEDVEDFA